MRVCVRAYVCVRACVRARTCVRVCSYLNVILMGFACGKICMHLATHCAIKVHMFEWIVVVFMRIKYYH